MRSAFEHQDAVIWCVSIPMKNKLVNFESQMGHKNLLKAMKETGTKCLIDWGIPSIPFEKDAKYFITVISCIVTGILFHKEKAETTAIGVFMVEQIESKEYIRSMPIIGS